MLPTGTFICFLHAIERNRVQLRLFIRSRFDRSYVLQLTLRSRMHTLHDTPISAYVRQLESEAHSERAQPCSCLVSVHSISAKVRQSRAS